MPRKRRGKKKSSISKPEIIQEKKGKKGQDDRIYIEVKDQVIPARKKDEKPKTQEELIKDEYMMEGQLHNFLVNRSGRKIIMQCYKLPTSAYARDDNREEKNAELRITIRQQAERRNIKLADDDIIMEAFPYGSEVYVKAYAYIDGKRHGDLGRDGLPKFIPIGKEGLFREE